jgi:hypothetical protein
MVSFPSQLANHKGNSEFSSHISSQISENAINGQVRLESSGGSQSHGNQQSQKSQQSQQQALQLI